jgi:hypothetical protein
MAVVFARDAATAGSAGLLPAISAIGVVVSQLCRRTREVAEVHLHLNAPALLIGELP